MTHVITFIAGMAVGGLITAILIAAALNDKHDN